MVIVTIRHLLGVSCAKMKLSLCIRIPEVRSYPGKRPTVFKMNILCLSFNGWVRREVVNKDG